MRINSECPGCGRLELRIDEIILVVSPGEGPWGENSWYIFDCTRCGQRVVKPAPRSVASALTALHVEVRTVPLEVLERSRALNDPQLSMDDLLDALLWLRTCHGVDDALAGA